MIDHVYVKNYKAFSRENIPLDKNTLLIGTNNTGKTTVLEALDLFFNNKLRYDFIPDTDKEIVIELHIDDTRYRKVYEPPSYQINYAKCMGDMCDINHLTYLYVPKVISYPKLLNDILTINLTKKPSKETQTQIFKVFDYIDGTLGNSNYKIFQMKQSYEMAIDDNLTFSDEQLATIITNITYQYVILGIDMFETHFDSKVLQNITKYFYQTILTTHDKSLVNEFDYFVHALYKEGIKNEFDTVRKQLSDTPKRTYLLVEGKYDVAWFETAVRLLKLSHKYRVIPCGGYGNIQYVEEQLKKEGFHTLVITDGDINHKHALKKDVIEQYSDLDFLNKRFNLSINEIPEDKYQFFKLFTVKDDIVKKILSSWARKNLTLENEFVQELKQLLL